MLVLSELFHFMNICVSFFKAYKVEGNEKFITQFNKVWKKYFHENFLIDFVVFLPLGLLGRWKAPLKLLWFLKLQRLHSFMEIIDEKFYNPILRQY